MAKKKVFNIIDFAPIYHWDQNQAKAKLNELYTKCLALADETIGWYQSNRISKGNAAKRIRGVSVALFLLSTLMPTLAVLFDGHKETFLYTGYIVAAIAGGILLLDKYYGYSTSWVRFVLTSKDLENLRNAFVENWQVVCLNNLPIQPLSFAVLVDSILKFQETFNGIVKAETAVWAQEFQQNSKDLIAEIKVQSDNFKAGIEQQRTDQTTAAPPANQYADSATLSLDDQYNLIKQAIAEYKENWKNLIRNYTGVTIGKKLQGPGPAVVNSDTYCIQFNVTKKEELTAGNIHAVPPYILFKGYKFPTDVIETGIIKSSVFSGEDIPLPKPLGVSIGRGSLQFAGTLGLRVKLADGGIYGMSCFHVLFYEELKAKTYEILLNNASGLINGPQVISPSFFDENTSSNNIGKVSHGKINSYIDCAFFKTDIKKIGKEIYQLGQVLDIYDLQKSDEKTLNVKYCGRTSGAVTSGTVFSAATYPTVTYFENTAAQAKFDFLELIQLKITAAEGDSGSIVLTENNHLLAMIIAVGSGYAYAVSMRSIYNNYPFTIA